MKKNKALFAVSSLGLGHATRTLVIIQHYLEKGYEIDVLSFGNALKYLQQELEGEHINFIEYTDYPPLERGQGKQYYNYLMMDLVMTNYLIQKEHIYARKIAKNYDFIFSDGKYGFYSRKIPSFLLSHQLAFVMPKGLEAFSKATEMTNFLFFKKFKHVFIPDFKEKEKSLAGQLSHTSWIKLLKHSYVGILSSFYNMQENIIGEQEEKIDYLFTISGYLMEEKEGFVAKLLQEASLLPGRKVFILGNTSQNTVKKLDNNITLYSYVSGEQRRRFFQAAEIIISRAGYTTIMDLVELGKKAILFPTPRQTEQEYLAIYLEKKNNFIIGKQKDSLQDLLLKLEKLELFQTQKKTQHALKKIDSIISQYL